MKIFRIKYRVSRSLEPAMPQFDYENVLRQFHDATISLNLTPYSLETDYASLDPLKCVSGMIQKYSTILPYGAIMDEVILDDDCVVSIRFEKEDIFQDYKCNYSLIK